MTRYHLNYLAPRKPFLTLSHFSERWRAHYSLASSLREWSAVRRYIQCEELDDENPRSYDRVTTVEYLSLEQ